MNHELIVTDDAAELASVAARHVLAVATRCADERGRFSMAVSGGHTPWAMFAELSELAMPWERTTIHQVDERVAPAGDDQRNLVHLRAALGGAPAQVVAMPVEATDLERAARDYSDRLPTRFDLVHLGLGTDGHTASLVPGDDVLEVTDATVAVTSSTYQGHRRMTLTYPGLALADRLVWLVSGRSKADALGRLLGGDRTIPAGRVRAGRSIVIADRDASGGSDDADGAQEDGP
ncbi:MAG: 6-phosphogluconolactonase [Microthrixaceae bacterium]